jgi:hypothetical protein
VTATAYLRPPGTGQSLRGAASVIRSGATAIVTAAASCYRPVRGPRCGRAARDRYRSAARRPSSGIGHLAGTQVWCPNRSRAPPGCHAAPPIPPGRNPGRPRADVTPSPLAQHSDLLSAWCS